MIGLGFVTYGCAASHVLKKEIAETPRNPETGVIVGCEARDIEAAGPVGDSTRAVLLVHGFCGSARDFTDLGDRLAARGLHVQLMRLPGHGTTPRDFAAQTPETIYEGVREEFEALKGRFDEVYVVGFSMGGSLTTILAASEPVDRLVLIAPYYGVTYKWYYILPPEAWNTILEPILPYVIKPKGSVKLNCPDEKDQVFSYRTIPTKGVGTLMDLGRRARRKETLQAVKCPVLMLMSEGDEAASPKRAREAFERIGSNRKILNWRPRRDNHHLLREWDREEVKQTIVDFLGT